MADINIYGRLWNQTTDGEIASAAQVKDSSFSKASEVDTSGSNPSQHDINEYLLDAIGTGGTASADALAQKVDKTTTINGKALDGDITLSASDLGIDTTLFKVVDTLPTSDIDTTKIYVVTSETTGTNNAYTEYIYVNSAWEKVGEYQASVDLSGYVKKQTLVTSSLLSSTNVLEVTNQDTGSNILELVASEVNSYLKFVSDTIFAELTTQYLSFGNDSNSLIQIGLDSDDDDNLIGHIYIGTDADDTSEHTEITKDEITIVDGYKSSTLDNEGLGISDTDNGTFLTLTDKKISLSYSDTNESTVIKPNSITLSGDDGTKTLTVTEIAKLEGIEEGAEKNKKAFGQIYIESLDTYLTATEASGYLNLYAGNNIVFAASSEDDIDKDLTISCTATADEALTEEEIDAACA